MGKQVFIIGTSPRLASEVASRLLDKKAQINSIWKTPRLDEISYAISVNKSQPAVKADLSLESPADIRRQYETRFQLLPADITAEGITEWAIDVVEASCSLEAEGSKKLDGLVILLNDLPDDSEASFSITTLLRLLLELRDYLKPGASIVVGLQQTKDPLIYELTNTLLTTLKQSGDYPYTINIINLDGTASTNDAISTSTAAAAAGPANATGLAKEIVDLLYNPPHDASMPAPGSAGTVSAPTIFHTATSAGAAAADTGVATDENTEASAPGK